jgi:hypothetical protein
VSLNEFLEKIQKKPRYIRFQILWLTVLVCMFLIGSLWVISLKYSLPDIAEKASQSLGEIKKEVKKEIPSLGEIFRASIGAFFEKNSLPEEENISEESQLTPQAIEDALGERTIKPSKLPLR